VPAPRSVKLYQDVLFVIENNVLVVVCDNNGDWAILRLGNRLRLDAWLGVTRAKLVNKVADALGSDFLGLVKRVFFVLDSVLNGKGRPLVDLEVEVAGVLAKGLGVNSGEIDLGAVLFGDSLEFLGESRALLCSLGKNVCKRETRLSHVS
jgi:hypothetical protein